MNILSLNAKSNCTKHIKNNFKTISKTIVQLSSGKKYNDNSENFIDQNLAKAIKNSRDTIDYYLNNISYANSISDFAHKSLSQIEDLLIEQEKIASMLSTSYSGNKEELTLQFQSLTEQIKNLIKTDFGSINLFNGSNIFFKIGSSETDNLKFQLQKIEEDEIYKKDATKAKALESDLKLDTVSNAMITKNTMHHSINNLRNIINDVNTFKQKLNNKEKINYFILDSLDARYSALTDIDITEISNQLIKDMLKLNAAVLSQIHENDALKNLISVLSNIHQ